MQTIKQQIQLAVNHLKKVTESAILEAEILLTHILKVERSYLYTHPNEVLSADAINYFWSFIDRRLKREPIAYLIGIKEFWSLPFIVNAEVLIPRPETEELIECILKLHDKNTYLKIADLGTGSGAIAIALARECPNWQIYATDLNQTTLNIAKKNAEKLNVHHLSFHQGHWCEALPAKDFDMIISNPPYIAEMEWAHYELDLSYEPKHALVSGIDGLDAMRQIISAAKFYLKPTGCIFIEHGFLQASMVRYLFQQAEYAYSQSIKDLSGKDRITWASICPV